MQAVISQGFVLLLDCQDTVKKYREACMDPRDICIKDDSMLPTCAMIPCHHAAYDDNILECNACQLYVCIY